MTAVEMMPTPWTRISAHWSARTWMRTVHLVSGASLALLGVAALSALAAAAVLLVWTVVVPVAALLLFFVVVRLLTRVQRSRFATFLDVDIAPVPCRPLSRNPLRRLLQETRTWSAWRRLGYHLLTVPINGIGALSVVGAWSSALITAVLAVRHWVLAETWQSVGFVFASGILFIAAPWVARGFTALDVIAAEALLGPSLSDQLVLRVETLRESRAGMVDAADAERRRIERDLHDGTQQRLVSLAMNLGMARATLTDLPEPAREVIVRAHEEAKLALRELRDVVRGLHPAVLDEQGLDAALSGLAARAPFPVRLRADLSGRTAPTVEAVAFFVVSEALTNIAKHARASGAEVVVGRDGDVLRLSVHDDGVGGADPDLGSGLRGLAGRVASVDGILDVDSPPGGPTTIRVELPCV
ncbi:sensor histidine kinase [Streptosporangium sp. NPDC023615]|uniref:sensor histidine kinase n=1 Tax=Streptosporangium sp. NPDC023615 TaxID=3154794 RepID=UPI00342126D8